MRGCTITVFAPLLLAGGGLLAGCGLTTLIAGPPFEVGDPDAVTLAQSDPTLDGGPPALDATEAAPDAASPESGGGFMDGGALADAADTTARDADAALRDSPYVDEPYIPPGDTVCVQQAPCGPYTVTAPVEFCVLFADGGAEVRPSPAANSMCSDYMCSDWTLPCDGTCADGTLGWPVVKITCR